MPKAAELKRKQRVSFFVTDELMEKLDRITGQTNFTISGVVRNALELYIQKLEKDRIAHELEEGYKENYAYYLKSQAEWDYADK